MKEYMDSFIEALGQMDPLWAYGFLLLSAFLENVIPPVPGDTVVVFSAASISGHLCRGNFGLHDNVLSGLQAGPRLLWQGKGAIFLSAKFAQGRTMA